MGAQTAKGLSADAAEEAASETLVHKFVITAATSHRPTIETKNKKRTESKTRAERCVGEEGGAARGGAIGVCGLDAALVGIYIEVWTMGSRVRLQMRRADASACWAAAQRASAGFGGPAER